MRDPPSRDSVLVFLPGIKGSCLRSGERRIWLTGSDLMRRGSRSLALPFEGSRGETWSAVEAEEVLEAIPLVPCWSVPVYAPWLERAAERGLLLPFPYDWRQDARETVARLARRVEGLVASGKKVSLVGHSLGGLIAFFYLRYGAGDPAAGVTWAGARSVRKVVLAGVPFGGSPSFLADIIAGDAVGRNRALLSKEAYFTFASAFQLLPREPFARDEQDRPLDLTRSGEWVERGLGVFADAALRDPAHVAQLERLLEASRAFRAGLAVHEGEAPPVEALVVVGTGRPTADRVKIVAGKVVAEGADRVPGDQRVTEARALPPGPLRFERFETPAEHGELVNDRKVQDAIDRFLAR